MPGFRLALPGSRQRFHCPAMTLPQLSSPSAPHPDGATHPIPQKHAEKTDQRPDTLTWGGKWGVVGDRMTSQQPRNGSCFLPKTTPLLRRYLDTLVGVSAEP